MNRTIIGDEVMGRRVVGSNSLRCSLLFLGNDDLTFWKHRLYFVQPEWAYIYYERDDYL